MNSWQHIYEIFNPVAFSIGGIKVHWYGIMYVLALLTALYSAKYFAKYDESGIDEKDLDNYFIWIEIGVILGARIGYIIFYDPHTAYYLTHPWQMFNPFMDGHFVGIRGMSYHGAIIGFLLGTFFYSLKYKKTNIWKILDLVAISAPLGYIFGRAGNFLNKELIGRATEVPWGIYVDGVLRHPSQLYEAFLEGFCVFLFLFIYRKRKRFDGELIALYGLLYSIARFIAEFFRKPDFQLGFVVDNWMSMGQVLSIFMVIASIFLYLYLYNRKKTSRLKK